MFGPALSPEFIQEAYGICLEGIENIKVAEGQIEDIKIKAMLRNMENHYVPLSADILKEQGFPDEVISVWNQMQSVAKQERERWIYALKKPEPHG